MLYNNRWLGVIYLWCILCVNSQQPTVAQTPNGYVCGPAICPWNNTLMCFVTEKSTDNELKLTKIGTCLNREGGVISEQTLAGDNTSKNHTDIISINIFNINSPNDRELRETIVGVIRSFVARSQFGTYNPYVQYGTPTPPNQPPPGTPQIIIVQPSSPQVVFADGRNDHYYNGPRTYGPEPQYPFQTVQNQPYQLPNVQPTILTEMFKLIDEIETKSRRLRELVKDASAGRATPYLEQRRNFREPFPVLVPPSF